MKRLSILLIALAAISLSSCGIFKKKSIISDVKSETSITVDAKAKTDERRIAATQDTKTVTIRDSNSGTEIDVVIEGNVVVASDGTMRGDKAMASVRKKDSANETVVEDNDVQLEWIISMKDYAVHAEGHGKMVDKSKTSTTVNWKLFIGIILAFLSLIYILSKVIKP